MRLRRFMVEQQILVAENEELAKTRRLTRLDQNIYVSVARCLLRKLAGCSGVFGSARDEGRSFLFALEGRSIWNG